MTTSRHRGPVEDGRWPDALDAHVVDLGPPRRIHGYDAVDDLARHYGPGEIALLAYTGELPNAAALRQYELAVALLAPVAVTSAAAHGAVLARLLMAPDANLVAIAASLAAEHAQHTVRDHAAWLSWCIEPVGAPPAEFIAARGDTRAAELTRELLHAAGIHLAAVERCLPTTTATALALLVAAGVRDALQLIGILVHAELPCLVAEAQRHPAGRLLQYPIGVPAFDYQEDDRG